MFTYRIFKLLVFGHDPQVTTKSQQWVTCNITHQDPEHSRSLVKWFCRHLRAVLVSSSTSTEIQIDQRRKLKATLQRPGWLVEKTRLQLENICRHQKQSNDSTDQTSQNITYFKFNQTEQPNGATYYPRTEHRFLSFAAACANLVTRPSMCGLLTEIIRNWDGFRGIFHTLGKIISQTLHDMECLGYDLPQERVLDRHSKTPVKHT